MCREYRAKYPDYPTIKLARIIYNEHPLIFKDVEGARKALRYIEGKNGKAARNWIKDPKKKLFLMEQPRSLNPYNIPDSYADHKPNYILPKACNNILLISDLHVPYHSIDAINMAFEYGQKNGVNTIFINGDLIDNAMVSKFEKDFRKRSVKEEFAITKEFLRVLRKTFPDQSIYWLKGNHCIRWEKFLMQKVSEIWNDPYFHLEERLALNEEKVILIDDDILVKAGKLSITHGHHIFKGIFSPVNPARGAFLKAKQSVIVGHLHRASFHPEIDLDGNVIGCWSTGCLCDLKPSYNPIVSNSQHGFAHILIDNSGNFIVKNMQIINGKIY